MTPSLPHNIEAEQAVLGSVLLNRDAMIVVDSVLSGAGDFYLAKHGAVYEAMQALFCRRQPPDLRLVEAELRSAGKLDAVGGVMYLASLTDAVPTSYHAEHYAVIVSKLALHRRLIDAGGRIAATSFDESLDRDELVAGVQKIVTDATVAATKTTFVPAWQSAARVFDGLFQEGEPGISTGIRDLDAYGGLRPEELTILAARPGVGKSALSLCIADSVAQQGHVAPYFSLEMSSEQLMMRLLSIRTGIDLYSIRNRKVDGDRAGRIGEVVSKLERENYGLLLEDSPGMTVQELRTRCLRLAMERDSAPGVVVVDYLQLLTPGERYKGSKVNEVGEISRALKNLSRELKCAVLALSQLSRAVEGRASQVPMLADLRDSGALEQDADNVWFIYREEMYEPETDKKGIAELHIAKHRNGPLGVVPMRFDAQTTGFHQLTYRTPEGY